MSSSLKGLVVLLGAGKVSGAGIARQFAKSGYAVALLARTESTVNEIAASIRDQGFIARGFVSDTTSGSLKEAFKAIDSHEDFKGLALKSAIWHVKNSMKKPFLETTEDEFKATLDTYVVGAFNFAQITIPRLQKSAGTLIFTGTLGALRTNSQFAAYGASRASVRMLAQALAKEYLDQVHVVHAIANGSIEDAHGQAQEEGKKMAAESVGKTYVWLTEQPKDLFCHEIDMRPGSEKF